MNNSDDIANLFKQFGGQADQYREIGRSNDAKLSRERWPLLSSVEATQPTDAPPVQHKDGLAQAPVPSPGLSALRATPTTPAQHPVVPESRAGNLGALRQEPVLGTEPALNTPLRNEPRLPSAPPQVPLNKAAPEPVTPAPQANTPPAKTSPAAEFIPPRPRPSTKFAHRTQQEASPAPLARLMPEPLPEAVPAPIPTPALTPSPAFSPAPLAPKTAAPAADTQSDLQSIFNRLAKPQRPTESPTQSDKNATLLQRLRRL